MLVERFDRLAQHVGIVDQIILHDRADFRLLLGREFGGGRRGAPRGGERAEQGGGEKQSERSFHLRSPGSLRPEARGNIKKSYSPTNVARARRHQPERFGREGSSASPAFGASLMRGFRRARGRLRLCFMEHWPVGHRFLNGRRCVMGRFARGEILALLLRGRLGRRSFRPGLAERNLEAGRSRPLRQTAAPIRQRPGPPRSAGDVRDRRGAARDAPTHAPACGRRPAVLAVLKRALADDWRGEIAADLGHDGETRIRRLRGVGVESFAERPALSAPPPPAPAPARGFAFLAASPFAASAVARRALFGFVFGGIAVLGLVALGFRLVLDGNVLLDLLVDGRKLVFGQDRSAHLRLRTPVAGSPRSNA